MKPSEIKSTRACDLGEKEWLKEIALQLAMLNEQASPEPTLSPVPEPIEKPKPRRGRPPKVKNV